MSEVDKSPIKNEDQSNCLVLRPFWYNYIQLAIQLI
jgi:hypothetical protein